MPLFSHRNTRPTPPGSAKSSSSTPDAQVILLEPNPTLSPLVEIVVLRCIAWNARRHCGGPPDAPPDPPGRPRVSSSSGLLARRRRPPAFDLDLIERLGLARTPSAPSAADGWARLAGRLDCAHPRAGGGKGRNPVNRPRSVRIRPAYIFFV
jgi:hypothetical protein